jgi:3-keto-disaccharide hydrolase
MRRWNWVFGFAVMLSLSGGPAARSGDKDQAFLNGKDLSGWEGLIDQYWKWDAAQKAIVGSTKPDGLKFNTFLCSTRTFGDFELQFQVKMTKTGNSGVQIRSHIHDLKKFAVTGPQCDMGGPYWGSLYGENFGGMMKAAPSDLVKKVLKEEDFNDYYIKAVGKHITIKLNGETTVDGDFPKAPETGIIAFQLHSGGPMEVIFKNIQFKEIKK